MISRDVRLRGQWLKYLKIEEKDISKFAVLCSQHFNDRDFDRSAFKVLLKPKAVPNKIVIRHKYTKASDSVILASDSENLPQPSTSCDTKDTKDIPITKEIPITTFPSEPVAITTEIEESDSPATVKIKQCIRNLAKRNVEQSQMIRKLQKKVWSQKQRLFKLSNVIKEFEKKNCKC